MFRTVGGLSGLVQTPRAREALLHLASSPLGLGCGSGAPPRSCWECGGCTGHRDVCSEGSRGGGLSQSSRRSRIKTSSPSLLHSAHLSPALSIWVTILSSVFPTLASLEMQPAVLKASSCQKGLFRWEGGCPLPQPAVPFSRHFRAWQVPIPRGA